MNFRVLLEKGVSFFVGCLILRQPFFSNFSFNSSVAKVFEFVIMTATSYQKYIY